jgi:4-amino-4-deoxy-L-arabinose transferase-like glycosyltransferase
MAQNTDAVLSSDAISPAWLGVLAESPLVQSIAWTALLGLMLLIMTGPELTRTQEARVLEGAREMVDPSATASDWLIPRLNGQIRLQKPPLAYWATAASYLGLGVSEWSGRLPAALAAWATVGLCFRIGRRVFSARAGYMSAAMLAGSFLFLRHGLLAETDVWVCLLVTLAADAMLRLFLTPELSRSAFLTWSHILGAAIGLTALAKGIPSAFPVLMLVGLAACLRRWDVPWRWICSGAPVTAIALGSAWYLYAGSVLRWQTFWTELRTATEGGGHQGSVLSYIPDLLVAILPWPAFMVTALIVAVQRWRSPELRALLTWCAAIALPLAVAGQKQNHYLMPLMPPLAILMGCIVDMGSSGSDSSRRLIERLAFFTAVGLAVAAVGPVAVGYAARHRVELIDIAVSAAVLAVAAGTIGLRRRPLAGLTVMVTAMPALLGLVVCIWSPRTKPPGAVAVGRDLRTTYAGRPFVFYGDVADMRLVFALRTVTPVVDSPERMAEVWAERPDTVALLWGPSTAASPPGGSEARPAVPLDGRDLRAFMKAP